MVCGGASVIEPQVRANHLSGAEVAIPLPDPSSAPADAQTGGEQRLWRPRRVLITPDALAYTHGRQMLERAEAAGAEVVRLTANRLPGFNQDTPGRSYANAKTTFAIVVAPPSSFRLQPIPPSADWQFHLAQGCPAHCQYCYLAGSLAGAPVTRAYANLDQILENLRGYAGKGSITSKSRDRAHEGTTFEASCYTDPLGIERLTGGLAKATRFFGAWEDAVQLRFTTKFAAVEPLLRLAHGGRTRVRFSLNAAPIARTLEGGTASMADRVAALRQIAIAGYPVGLTIAPIMPVEGWQREYRDLLAAVSAAVADRPHRRAHHASVHAGLEGGAAGLVSQNHTRHGRGEPHAEADQVRQLQVCLPEGQHDGDARLLRADRSRTAAGGTHPLLDVSSAGSPGVELGLKVRLRTLRQRLVRDRDQVANLPHLRVVQHLLV